MPYFNQKIGEDIDNDLNEAYTIQMATKTKKTVAIQLALGKQFNHGGARKGAGRKGISGARKTFWLTHTTLAMVERFTTSGQLTADEVISAAMVALADLNLVGGIQEATRRSKLTARDVIKFAGN